MPSNTDTELLREVLGAMRQQSVDANNLQAARIEVAELRVELAEVLRQFRGNGKPPLLVRIAALETSNNAQRLDGLRMWQVRMALGSGFFGSLFAPLLVWWIVKNGG